MDLSVSRFDARSRTRGPVRRTLSVVASVLAVGVLLTVTNVGLGPASTAGAAACASASKSIGGLFVGEDGRRISGFVGIALFDGAGNRINEFGCPYQPGDDGPDGYTFYTGVNTVNGCCFTLPAAGADPNNTAYANTWRIDGLPSNAAKAWVETYPKSNAQNATDYSRYGGAMLRSAPVGLNVDLRMPLGCSSGGNTGAISGTVTKNGAPTTVSYVVAFSLAAEGTGQILGFVAANSGQQGGTFTVPQLEPGQNYALEIRLTDGSMYWFENDYGTGVPVSACATTTRSFDARPDGHAVAVDGPTNGPGYVDTGAGSTLFFRGGDGALWYRSGQAPVSLGGQILGDPDVTTFANGAIDVVVRGVDNRVYHRNNKGGSWGPWSDLGGGTSSGPTIASWGGSRLDVFIAGLDHQLWHRASADGVNWGGWEALGGYVTSSPDASSWGVNRIDIGVRGGDNALWHRFWDNGWSGWEYLGGVLNGGPAVTAPASNRLDFAVRGSNNAVYLKSWNGAQWVGWSVLNGGLTSADPDATSAGGRSTVCVLGGDGVFYINGRSTPSSNFGGWIPAP